MLNAVLAASLAALLVAALGWRRSRLDAARLRRRLETASQQLQHLQHSFARFAPEDLVDRIAATGKPLAAAKRDVTVLFADLVGFTRLGEALDPEQLVRVLNGYFGRMSRVVGDHRGHVAKFIGDGMMALFGSLEPNPWQANDAVHAALGMREALAAYDTELAAEGLPVLRFGVGIHRGSAVAGIVGSKELLEFTVIGHTVNMASRVEGLTRIHGVDILVTDEVKAALDPRFVLKQMPAQAVRGVREPVVTWAVERFEAG